MEKSKVFLYTLKTSNKVSCFFIFLFLLFSCSNKDNEITLSTTWLFHKGDSVHWSGIDYSDNTWDSILSGQYWTYQAYTDYTGRAWYRQKVFIPSSVKDNPYFKKYPWLVLNLGRIGEVDQVFFNDSLVGQTGCFNPYEPEPKKWRKYTIPASIIRYNDYNIIAVRVESRNYRAGLYAGPYSISPRKFEEFCQLTPIPASFDGLFYDKDSIKLSLRIKLDTANPFDANINLSCKLLPDLLKPDTLFFSDQKNFILTPGDSMQVSYRFKPTKPGFYKYQFIITNEKKDTQLIKYYRLGYEPEKITPRLSAAGDFHAFWKESLQQLSETPPSFSMEKSDEYSNDSVICYKVSMLSLDSITVYGWYCKPVKPGKYPALLEVPWHTGGLPPRNDLPDFCVFTLHIRGHGMSQGQINPGFPGFLQWNISHQKNYIYRGAYMDCIRAVDFLLSRHEVDTAKVGVFGISQGGGLTFVTAALDKRIKIAYATVPFLSYFEQYFKTVPWPADEFVKYIKDNPQITMDSILQVLSYFDIMNLAPEIQCPLYMAVGLQDETCPPVINFAAYNQVKSPKSFIVYPNHGHNAGGNNPMILKMKDFFLKKN